MGRLWSRLKPRSNGAPAPRDTYTDVEWAQGSPLPDLWTPPLPPAAPADPVDPWADDRSAEDPAAVFDRVFTETGAPRNVVGSAHRASDIPAPPIADVAPPQDDSPQPAERDFQKELLRRRVEAIGRRLKLDRDEPLDISDTPRVAESEVRAAMALHLAGEGFHVRRTEPRAHGVLPSLAAFKDERELWLACRGYPGQGTGVSAAELSRQWLAVAILDLIGYRTADQTIELGLALPDVQPYHRLIAEAEWALESMGVTLWLVGDHGIVRTDADPQTA
jgi:hypothetical protein